MTPSAYAPAPRFLALGDGFADVVRPAAFPEHRLRFRNERWAARVLTARTIDEVFEG